MKRNKIDTMGSTEKDKHSKGLVPVRPSLIYSRGTLGQPLSAPFPDFDLWDPNMHLIDWTYNNLHDPHLKRFFSQPSKKRLLVKHGLITHDEKVLCSRKEFSQYMNYIKTVQQSWEKLFVQEQKQLLKELMLQQLRGHATATSVMQEIKENLVPVLLEEQHDGSTTPWSSAHLSSDFLPVYSSSEDMAQTDAESTNTPISYRDSISPVISHIPSEESCDSSLLNSASLSGSFSDCSATSTDVMTFESKLQSSDSLPKVKSQSTVTVPGKLKRSAEDVCGLDMPTVTPYFEGSINMTTAIKMDLAEDIESTTSRDSRNQSPLLAKAEMVVLDVVNQSVDLLKSLASRQMETCCYKDPHMQMTDNDIQSSNTESNIEEILHNLPSSSLSSLSSLTSISEEEVTLPLTERSKYCSLICHLSSSCISMISQDIVESSLERVISTLKTEGLLDPQHASEEMNESSSCKSSDPDTGSESGRCVSVGPIRSQNDSGYKLIGGHNSKRSIPSPETETEVEVTSCPPSESVMKLLDTTSGNKAKTTNLVKSAFKQLTKPIFKKLHIQFEIHNTKRTVNKFMAEELSAEGTLENSCCTIDSSDSPSSAKPVSEHYSETVLRVVERNVTEIIMDTFRLHRSPPESASLNQDFERLVSSHPPHDFLLCLQSSIMETVMEQLFVPQQVTDATRAENPAGTPGATEEFTQMPVMENTSVGSKPKKMKRVQTFFKRAWQAVKKTFRVCRRSNKILPL